MAVNNNIKSKGFTLIELAITLVIIGLLVGGVLVGRDLIENAKIRSQTQQIVDIETQMNTFKLKYNCLPGDCPNATDYFGTTDPSGNTIYNGNGDGVVKSVRDGNGNSYGAGDCMSPDISGEASQLFLQMYLSGINKDYTTGKLSISARVGKEYPYAKFGNGTGFFVSCLTGVPNWTVAYTMPFLATGNFIVIGSSGSASCGGRIIYQSGIANYNAADITQDLIVGSGCNFSPIGIPAEAIRKIDEKIDDGKPSTGKLLVFAGDHRACSLGFFGQAKTANYYPSPSTVCNATFVKKID